MIAHIFIYTSCCSVTQSCPTVHMTPWTAALQLSFTISQSLLPCPHCLPEFAQTHVH